MYHQTQEAAESTATRGVDDAKAEDTGEHLVHRRMFPDFGMYLKAEKLHLRFSFGFHNTRPDEALLPSATKMIPTAETPRAPMSRASLTPDVIPFSMSPGHGPNCTQST